MAVTRRGFLQGIAAATASTALVVRSNTLPAPPVEVLEAEILGEEEVGFLRPRGATKLESYLRSRGIKPAHLARECGYSRQHLLRVRMGKMEPTRRCIAAIVAACRRIARERVQPSDLFELERP